MSEDLKKEIEAHLASFPERRLDVVEMRKEWNEYKNKALWILLGFSGSILAIGIWAGTMQTNIDSILTKAREESVRVTVVENRVTSLEITNSEIRARLSSIDLALQEIKIAINKLD